jgi:hypothetical protein
MEEPWHPVIARKKINSSHNPSRLDEFEYKSTIQVGLSDMLFVFSYYVIS